MVRPRRAAAFPEGLKKRASRGARTARRSGGFAVAVVLAIAPVACRRGPNPAAGGGAAASTAANEPLVAPASASATDPGVEGAQALHGTPCPSIAVGAGRLADAHDPADAVDCAQYASPLEAFEDALAVAGPAANLGALGVGEVHAPAGAKVASAAKRFTDVLLPALAGRASDVLLELMMPPTGCADAAATARREQEPVTSQHAASAEDEYLALGQRARALGIVPDMLRPTCDDLHAIEHAGDNVVDVSLTTIATLALSQGTRLVDRDARSERDRGKIVILYGGSLHNDLSPTPDAAHWSYAPALAEHLEALSERFVAIDLVVPEFIRGGAGPADGGTDAWQNLPWWPRYAREARADKVRLGRKPTLFRVGPKSFVLLFAMEPPP